MADVLDGLNRNDEAAAIRRSLDDPVDDGG